MPTISTKLVRDGNSAAVRLSKPVLALSGLKDTVRMDVQQGKIVLRPASSPRADWKARIAHVAATDPRAVAPDPELTGWVETSCDGLSQTN